MGWFLEMAGDRGGEELAAFLETISEEELNEVVGLLLGPLHSDMDSMLCDWFEERGQPREWGMQVRAVSVGGPQRKRRRRR